MREASGQKLFRSPFPASQPPRSPDSDSNGEQAPDPSEGGSSIADIETKEIPAYPPEHDSAIINAETIEIAAAPNQTFNTSSTANAFHPNIFSYPLIPFSFPSTSVSPVAASDKGRRVQLSMHKKLLLLALLIALLAPSLLAIFELINAVSLYRDAEDGITHLQAIQAIFHGSAGSSSGISQYFDTGKLRQAQQDIEDAHADFVSLSEKLDTDASVSVAADFLSPQVGSLRALGHIASDGTEAGQILIKTVIDIAPSIASALKQNPSQAHITSLKPFITPTSFQEINTTLVAIEPYVHRMALYAHGLSLNSLPLSNTQQQLLASVLPLLPIFDAGLVQERSFSSELAWLLGVGQQRIFLIEPMDSAELRATGGFTGQFGELLLNGAHVGPLHLENIGKYEEDHTAEGSPPDPTIYPKVVGQTAPAPYSAWWPVANFGLRDANLSADFPTSARIAMNRYTYEFGQQVDGVMMFTPTLMEQILQVTGPITIPAYKETITAQNMVDRLHYYQLNNTGIRREEIIEHVDDPQVARKLFTQRVTTALISAVTHLPLNKLLPMGNQMLHSMKTRDLQIYVTNPQVESLIGKFGSTASLDRSNSHDGLFIVQSNLSASKASQYVTTTIRDAITLDAQGGATHHLLMTLNYQQKGDVYGFDTYRDYVRVYVPTNSQLIAGNGFDQYDRPYCGDAQSAYSLCQSDVYSDGSLVCATPIEIGYATAYLNDPYAGTDHPLDMIGPPTNLQSDEAGRAMFGGWVVIPKNCTMKVTLSWYVPPTGQHPYDLLLQAQASVFAPLDLTIQPDQKTCVPTQGNVLHFSTVMNGEDMNIMVKQQGSTCSLTSH